MLKQLDHGIPALSIMPAHNSIVNPVTVLSKSIDLRSGLNCAEAIKTAGRNCLTNINFSLVLLNNIIATLFQKLIETIIKVRTIKITILLTYLS